MWTKCYPGRARSREVDSKAVHRSTTKWLCSTEGPGVLHWFVVHAKSRVNQTERTYRTTLANACAHCRHRGLCAELSTISTSTLNPPTLQPQPSTLDPIPCTLHPAPSTPNSQPSTTYPKPQPLNPQPSTLDPHTSASNQHSLASTSRRNFPRAAFPNPAPRAPV